MVEQGRPILLHIRRAADAAHKHYILNKAIERSLANTSDYPADPPKKTRRLHCYQSVYDSFLGFAPVRLVILDFRPLLNGDYPARPSSAASSLRTGLGPLPGPVTRISLDGSNIR